MRYTTIINLLLFVCFFQQAKSQSFAVDSLVELEYRYFKCSNEQDKQQILIQKVNHYLLQNYTGTEVLNEIKRIEPQFLTDSLQRAEFYWNAAILAYLNGANNFAEFNVNQYCKDRTDLNFEERLLKLIIVLYKDTLAAKQEIGSLSVLDSSVWNLNACIEKETYTRKHKNLYLLSSAILPGSGTAMNGAVLKGLTSLLLVSSAAFGVAALVHHQLYFNALMWGTGIGIKFYVGNLQLTEQQFKQKQELTRSQLSNTCSDCLSKVLKSRPLSLKIL